MRNAQVSGQSCGQAARTVVATLPILFLFLLFQRYLVQGISTTGLKG